MFVIDNDGDYCYHNFDKNNKQFDVLPTGIYRVNFTMAGMYFQPEDITQSGLVKLRTTIAREAMAEVKSFLDPETRERLASAGVPNRRGMIFHGPPGTGKTSLVRSLFPRLLKAGVVILLEPPVSRLAGTILPAVQSNNPNRSVALFFDEIDRHSSGTHDEMKSLLDGINSPNHILTIACTNHLDKLPVALTERPSRFSLIREMPAPSAEVRKAYMRLKFPMVPDEVASDLAGFLLDKPLDYVQEVCTLYLRGWDVEQIRGRLSDVKPSSLVLENGDDEDDENQY